jgi:hypothetical protein
MKPDAVSQDQTLPDLFASGCHGVVKGRCLTAISSRI